MNKFVAVILITTWALAYAEPPLLSSEQSSRRPSTSYGTPTGSYLPPHSIPSSSYGVPSNTGHGGSSYHTVSSGFQTTQLHAIPSKSYIPQTGSYLPPNSIPTSYKVPSYYRHGHGNGNGGYNAVSSGFQTSEGLNVDPSLLHKIKEILINEENSALHGYKSSHGHSSHVSTAPSTSYGLPSTSYGTQSVSFGSPTSKYLPPSSSYGVPEYNSRVVSIDLGHINQATQVAQYDQQSYAPSYSQSYTLPSSHLHTQYHQPSKSYAIAVPVQIATISSYLPPAPSNSYSVPSGSYGVPSGSYGVPSSSYGVPSGSHGVPSSSYGVPSSTYGTPHH